MRFGTFRHFPPMVLKKVAPPASRRMRLVSVIVLANLMFGTYALILRFQEDFTFLLLVNFSSWCVVNIIIYHFTVHKESYQV